MTAPAPAPAPAPLDPAEQRALARVAASMVPASTEFGVPGADDPLILADILRSLGRDTLSVRQALAQIAALADGGGLADLPVVQAETVLERFRSAHPALAMTLVNVVTRCYYRDDRVMRSLSMELRAPFPKGFEVEAGDWSLLEPVRARGPIHRPPGPNAS